MFSCQISQFKWLEKSTTKTPCDESDELGKQMVDLSVRFFRFVLSLSRSVDGVSSAMGLRMSQMNEHHFPERNEKASQRQIDEEVYFSLLIFFVLLANAVTLTACFTFVLICSLNLFCLNVSSSKCSVHRPVELLFSVRFCWLPINSRT